MTIGDGRCPTCKVDAKKLEEKIKFLESKVEILKMLSHIKPRTLCRKCGDPISLKWEDEVAIVKALSSYLEANAKDINRVIEELDSNKG